MELAFDALLNAQRVFKLEVDHQWKTLQDAMIPLQLQLQISRQHASQEKIKGHMPNTTVAGPPMSTDPEEAAFCKVEDAHPGRKVIGGSHTTTTETKLELNALERVEAEEAARDEANEMKKEQCWQHWLRSPRFDMLVGGFIIANMLLLMLGIQYEGAKNEPGLDSVHSSEIDAVLRIFEHIFTAFFLLELILRLAADGVRYFYSISNGLDGLIVFGSCLDSWVFPALTGGSNGMGVSLLRVFRLLRLAKVLRVVRVMKAFAPLRVLIQAVFSSIGALLWSMALLLLLEIMGAIVLAQLLAPVITDKTRDLHLREKIWNSYGTMLRSWLTFYEITMAPGSFLQHRYLFDEVHPLLSIVIAGYVCFVTFAVIRVITALFLKATLSTSDLESRRELTYTKMRRLDYAKRLCSSLEEYLCQARIDRNGLAKLLTFKRFTNWLDDAGLTAKDATRLFKALDTGDGFVDLDEFLTVISQICDAVADRDAILHHESASLVNAVMHMCTLLRAGEARGPPVIPLMA